MKYKTIPGRSLRGMRTPVEQFQYTRLSPPAYRCCEAYTIWPNTAVELSQNRRANISFLTHALVYVKYFFPAMNPNAKRYTKAVETCKKHSNSTTTCHDPIVRVQPNSSKPSLRYSVLHTLYDGQHIQTADITISPRAFRLSPELMIIYDRVC